MDTFITILKNISWEDRIDWFFRIIQIATFIILIVKVNAHKGYIDNVQLIEIDDLQKIDENTKKSEKQKCQNIIENKFADFFHFYSILLRKFYSYI